jgi:hypothetical protein
MGFCGWEKRKRPEFEIKDFEILGPKKRVVTLWQRPHGW